MTTVTGRQGVETAVGPDKSWKWNLTALIYTYVGDDVVERGVRGALTALESGRYAYQENADGLKAALAQLDESTRRIRGTTGTVTVRDIRDTMSRTIVAANSLLERLGLPGLFEIAVWGPECIESPSILRTKAVACNTDAANFRARGYSKEFVNWLSNLVDITHRRADYLEEESLMAIRTAQVMPDDEGLAENLAVAVMELGLPTYPFLTLDWLARIIETSQLISQQEDREELDRLHSLALIEVQLVGLELSISPTFIQTVRDLDMLVRRYFSRFTEVSFLVLSLIDPQSWNNTDLLKGELEKMARWSAVPVAPSIAALIEQAKAVVEQRRTMLSLG